MKKSALLVSLAGLACAGAAFASDDAPLNMGQVRMTPPSTGFGARPVVVVWGTNASDFRGYNTTVPPARSANDINFAGGPAGAVVGGVNLVGSYFAAVTPAGATNVTCDIRISTYSTFGGWVDGTFPGTGLLGQGTLAGFVGNPGFVNFYDPTTNIAMALGSMTNTAGTDGVMVVEVFEPATTTLHATTWTPASIGTAVNVGQTDPQRWGDSTGPGGLGGPDGLMQPLNGAAVWEVNAANVAGGRAIYGGLWADVPVPPPTPVEAVGCLADGTTSDTETIAAGQVKWYSICLNAAADDDFLKYLDVDSEGSVDDVEMCLYNNAGAIVGYPGNDDGTGSNAQLSFGVGRRVSPGGPGAGAQYDGRMGDLLDTGANLYYVAVGGLGTTFGPSFTASGAGVATPTNATTNFRTNVNGGANLASVVPDINGVDFNDPINFDLAPGTTTGAQLLHDSLSVDSVRWSTFTLTNAVCAGGGYVDMNFADPALSDAISDLVAWVFDSNGDIVAFSDDTGGTNKPQFSFGVASPARPPYGASTQDFSGQDGNLEAGVYYVATALYDPDDSDLGLLPNGHRWHVRGASLSSTNGGTIIDHAVGTDPTCGGGVECDSIDFNNDTSFFDPQDIDAFLSVYSEGDCIPVTATCNDIDFNNDTSVFDPCDIASFLQVYAEGACELCPV